MINKKIIFAAAAASLAFTSAFALTAFAQDSMMRKDSMMNLGKGPIKAVEHALDRLEKFETGDFQRPLENAPSTLAVNPRGETKITNGKVTAVNGDIVSVEIWKMSFSVHKMPDTKVFAGRAKEFSWDQIKVGDIVDVLGKLDTAQSMFIHAQVVHDRSQLMQARDEETSRLRQLINDLVKRLNEILVRQGRQPLPTPSPSASASPSPSASASPSPSPSASVTPSPSPSPSQSASPTPSPSTT